MRIAHDRNRPPSGLGRASAALAAVAALSAAVLGACGDDGTAAPTREYTLHLRAEEPGDEYEFIAEDPVDIQVGDRVTIEVRNAGALNHDLQVVDPAGDTIATAGAVAPGGTLSVVVDFDETGYYRLNCLVDDHLTKHRMQAIVEVTDATG